MFLCIFQRGPGHTEPRVQVFLGLVQRFCLSQHRFSTFQKPQVIDKLCELVPLCDSIVQLPLEDTTLYFVSLFRQLRCQLSDALLRRCQPRRQRNGIAVVVRKLLFGQCHPLPQIVQFLSVVGKGVVQCHRHPGDVTVPVIPQNCLPQTGQICFIDVQVIEPPAQSFQLLLHRSDGTSHLIDFTLQSADLALHRGNLLVQAADHLP